MEQLYWFIEEIYNSTSENARVDHRTKCVSLVAISLSQNFETRNCWPGLSFTRHRFTPRPHYPQYSLDRRLESASLVLLCCKCACRCCIDSAGSAPPNMMRFWNTASKQAKKYTLGTDPKENTTSSLPIRNRPRTDQKENAPAANKKQT
jgi:hypothetical protein